MRIQLKEKQVKLREILQLNPTIDNPLDELTYSHWIHRVTNICLDAAQMPLTSLDTSPGMNLRSTSTSISVITDPLVGDGEYRYHVM